MKKTYMKPEVNEIEVAANQAVAACGMWRCGYENSSTRGVGQGSGKYGYSTTDAAWKAYNQYEMYNFTTQKGGIPGKPEYNQQYTNGPWVYNVMYAEGIDPNGKPFAGTFNDLNSNGIWDSDDYNAWQTGDYNAWVDVCKGNATAVVNS